MLEFSVGKRLMENYLNQPYSWFLSHNSNELVKNILSEVTHVIENAIYPFAEMIAKGMVAISLLSLLIFTDIKLALSIGFSIGGIYGGEGDAIKSGVTGYLCNGNDLNAIYDTFLKILSNKL